MCCFLKPHSLVVQKGKRNETIVERLVSHSDTKVWYHRAWQIRPCFAASVAGAKQFLRAGC